MGGRGGKPPPSGASQPADNGDDGDCGVKPEEKGNTNKKKKKNSKEKQQQPAGTNQSKEEEDNKDQENQEDQPIPTLTDPSNNHELEEIENPSRRLLLNDDEGEEEEELAAANPNAAAGETIALLDYATSALAPSSSSLKGAPQPCFVMAGASGKKGKHDESSKKKGNTGGGGPSRRRDEEEEVRKRRNSVTDSPLISSASSSCNNSSSGSDGTEHSGSSSGGSGRGSTRNTTATTSPVHTPTKRAGEKEETEKERGDEADEEGAEGKEKKRRDDKISSSTAMRHLAARGNGGDGEGDGDGESGDEGNAQRRDDKKKRAEKAKKKRAKKKAQAAARKLGEVGDEDDGEGTSSKRDTDSRNKCGGQPELAGMPLRQWQAKSNATKMVYSTASQLMGTNTVHSVTAPSASVFFPSNNSSSSSRNSHRFYPATSSPLAMMVALAGNRSATHSPSILESAGGRRGEYGAEGEQGSQPRLTSIRYHCGEATDTTGSSTRKKFSNPGGQLRQRQGYNLAAGLLAAQQGSQPALADVFPSSIPSLAAFGGSGGGGRPTSAERCQLDAMLDALMLASSRQKNEEEKVWGINALGEDRWGEDSTTTTWPAVGGVSLTEEVLNGVEVDEVMQIFHEQAEYVKKQSSRIQQQPQTTASSGGFGGGGGGAWLADFHEAVLRGDYPAFLRHLRIMMVTLRRKAPQRYGGMTVEELRRFVVQGVVSTLYFNPAEGTTLLMTLMATRDCVNSGCAATGHGYCRMARTLLKQLPMRERAKLLAARTARCEKTAAHFAATIGQPCQLLALLEHNVDVDVFDRSGRTPLHYAIERNNLEMVRILLWYGADGSLAPLGAYAHPPRELALDGVNSGPGLGRWLSRRLDALENEVRRWIELALKHALLIETQLSPVHTWRLANLRARDLRKSTRQLSLNLTNVTSYSSFSSSMQHSTIPKPTHHYFTHRGETVGKAESATTPNKTSRRSLLFLLPFTYSSRDESSPAEEPRLIHTKFPPGFVVEQIRISPPSHHSTKKKETTGPDEEEQPPQRRGQPLGPAVVKHESMLAFELPSPPPPSYQIQQQQQQFSPTAFATSTCSTKEGDAEEENGGGVREVGGGGPHKLSLSLTNAETLFGGALATSDATAAAGGGGGGGGGRWWSRGGGTNYNNVLVAMVALQVAAGKLKGE